MHADLAMQMMGELFRTGLLVSLPVLVATMLVGLVISVLQVVTQVQEMSLSFVPKLVVAAVTLVVAGPWSLRQITGYTVRLWSTIPAMT